MGSGKSMFLLATAHNFQEKGIVVYDSLKVINWDDIDIEYRHCNPLYYADVRAICTHHYSDINKDNCIIS